MMVFVLIVACVTYRAAVCANVGYVHDPFNANFFHNSFGSGNSYPSSSSPSGYSNNRYGHRSSGQTYNPTGHGRSGQVYNPVGGGSTGQVYTPIGHTNAGQVYNPIGSGSSPGGSTGTGTGTGTGIGTGIGIGTGSGSGTSSNVTIPVHSSGSTGYGTGSGTIGYGNTGPHSHGSGFHGHGTGSSGYNAGSTHGSSFPGVGHGSSGYSSGSSHSSSFPGYGSGSSGYTSGSPHSSSFPGYGSGSSGYSSGSTQGSNPIGHGSGSNSYGSSLFGSSRCPTPVDLSAGQGLSSDATGYPESNITAEIAARPELAQCFPLTTLLPGAPGVPHDPALNFATSVCATHRQTLRRFSRYGSSCWLLNNVQEEITIAHCLTKACHGCEKDAWDNTRNMCVQNFIHVSVWAFCANLPVNAQIMRERLLIPDNCNCKKLACSNGYN